MSSEQLGKLLLLSLVWGGSFLFSGMAVVYVHPLWLVTIRVTLAAVVMLLVLRYLRIPLPQNLPEWLAYLGMGVLNNVIPFTAIFYAQTFISVSLASIINAMTPVFTFLVLAAFKVEALSVNRVCGALVGIGGTVMLFAEQVSLAETASVGLLLGLLGALGYAFASLWGKLFLQEQPPVKAATSQLLSSAVVMLVLVTLLQVPLPPSMPPMTIIAAILALALLSTAFAYVLFFDIFAKSGPSNAMLVTLLVPISASLLGWLVMGDQLSLMQICGALIIGLGLVIIDGRLLKKLTQPNSGESQQS